MHRAWDGRAARVLLDDGAAHTAQNAAHVTHLAREMGAREILVVTSRWHARRAGVAFRVLLRGSPIEVAVVAADGRHSLGGRVREAAVWPVFGLQLTRAQARVTPPGCSTRAGSRDPGDDATLPVAARD